MYNISDIKGIHLETTSKCQARCPQCGRMDYYTNEISPYITDRNGKSGSLDEIYLTDFIKWFSPEFVSQLDLVYMCGTVGEPIMARDCLKIFNYLRLVNPKIELSLHTNGGFRTKDWWEKLAKLKVEVVFGIDGLEDTHALYRVNTKWEQIIENAQAFINAGGKATWQMLVFKHNEHQVLECIKLAKSLGFNYFRVVHTTRFGENDYKKMAVVNPKGEVTHYLEPSSVSLAAFEKINLNYSSDHFIEVDQGIDCSVKKSRQIYVSANGDLTPCCWMMSSTMFIEEDILDYKKKINLYPNLYKNTLKEIFDSLYFKKIEETWYSDDPLLTCSRSCGKKTSSLESIFKYDKFIKL